MLGSEPRTRDTGLRAWEASGRLIIAPFPGPAGNATDPAFFSRDFANAMMRTRPSTARLPLAAL